MTSRAGPIRLAVVLDPAEEGWTSMEYVGEMLVATLRENHAAELHVTPIQPHFPRVFGSAAGTTDWLRTSGNRLIARCIVYPIAIARHRANFDYFHVVDHSYAHAVHGVPGERTGIYCHDLDALAPLLDKKGSHPPWRHVLARSILRAMQRAAVIFFSTYQVHGRILKEGLLEKNKLVYAPYGVAPEFTYTSSKSPEDVGWRPKGPFLLHVGSSVPRKRLELLLKAFAKVRAVYPDLILVQQGAILTPAQNQLVQQLELASCFVQPAHLSRASLATLYRNAALVVLSSEREGFGLPVVEALACGASVLASDIPAFREVGGDAVAYTCSGDPALWRDSIVNLLASPHLAPSLASRLARAARFSWAEHTRVIASSYLALV
jgi:glycosyltransferase involved in cell wall biosynthesis